MSGWLLRIVIFVVCFLFLRQLLLRSFSLFQLRFLWPILPKQQVFLYTLFSMMAKLAKVDGRIGQEEINAIELYITSGLGLDAEMRRRAIAVFREAKESAVSFEAYGSLLWQHFSTEPAILSLTLEILFGLATADGGFSPAEDQLLRRLALLFQLSEQRYEVLRYTYLRASGCWEQQRQQRQQQATSSDPLFGSSLAHHYAVLNCSATATNEEIKSSYRKLAREHHPDRLVAKGYPQQLIQAANRRLAEINTAYEAIEKARGAVN